MFKWYKRWLNRRIADALEEQLHNGNYQDSQFMCTALRRDMPLFLGLFHVDGITSKACAHVQKKIGRHLTLFGHLTEIGVWKYCPGHAFIEEAGIPFYRNMIKELREEK